jgi:formylglycine-generating enzyme required for sulfatase activity
MVLRRMAAATALDRIEKGAFGMQSQYWSFPHGEPIWVTIPAGEFWMGSEQGWDDEKPVHRLYLPEFRIARTPVTNAQYLLYVQATGAEPPGDWVDGQPPKDKLGHPVVEVSWHDAHLYCAWLSKVTGHLIRLPTEVEWEKAARGDKDQREYPWGERFEAVKCNSMELELPDTTPVGLFPEGASSYGCLDMSGNVWEWVQDWYNGNYYQQGPGRNLAGPDRGDAKVVRGGSWGDDPGDLRVSYRDWNVPGLRLGLIGFRCAR